ncbi:SapC family protein [Teredinibacter turnerae]|uniref:SapC family protein n=1 Tax=Teredinibacter turnerae TaxID=2426 RepID=UPI001F0792F4|nr:SapC family protein [Teredinibacter turnerae]
MSTLMFYEEPVPLEKKKHVDLKLDRTQNYAFAKTVNSVPLSGMEFFQASRDFPILFIKNAEGKYLPMAILSLREASHDMGDNWEGVYVPAFIRRYPFVLTADKVVMIDNKAPHLNTETGDQLFAAENEPSDTLKQIVNFLELVDKSFRQTEEFAAALAEKELLEPYNATVKYDNNTVKLNDLYAVNEKKLHESLEKDETHEWFKKGWIAWSYAHLHSLGSMHELVLRQRKSLEAAGAESNEETSEA